jgi:hypothetical protein
MEDAPLKSLDFQDLYNFLTPVSFIFEKIDKRINY